MFESSTSKTSKTSSAKPLKSRVYDILDMDDELKWGFSDREKYCEAGTPVGSRINLFNKFIIVIIILNALAFVLETFDPIADTYAQYFLIFEVISVIIFGTEYVLRLWTCTDHPAYRGFTGRLRYMTKFFAIIDLVSFLPALLMLIFTFVLPLPAIALPFVIPADYRYFRILRLLRLLRVSKLMKYSKSMITFKNVIVDKKDDLILTFLLGVFILFIASSLMFQFEHDAQPENFANIFDAVYWGIVPLTTVGYGDIYPQTGEGKLISAVITLACITMVALPTGILSSGFIEEMKKSKEECEVKEPETIKCPHCQKEIDLNTVKESADGK